MGEHITVEDSFDYVKKATEPLQQRNEELEAELEAQKKDKAGIAVSNSKLMFENKRLRDAIGAIKTFIDELDADDYDNPREASMAFNAIDVVCIKALKEGE